MHSQTQPFKIFTIEVWPDGKICLPSFVTPDIAQLSINELAKCRDLIDLIIANPDNFHVVKTDILPEVAIPKSWLPGPACKACNKSLSCQTQTERENLLCFDCERKQILDKVNQPVGNYVEQLKSTLTPEQKELICKKCFSLKPMSKFPFASMVCYSCKNKPGIKDAN